MTDTIIDQHFIDQIENLLECAKTGQNDKVNELLDELSASRETELYQQLGKLTRDFHEALSDFGSDSKISEISNSEFEDARERLQFVVTKTQEAADQTMTQIENSIPLCDSLIHVTQEISKSWNSFTKKEMNVEEFRELSKKIKVFLDTANKDGETLKTNLNEVMLAQDFQDITGQVIFKVIKLVEDIENSLVNLIKLASENGLENQKTDNNKKDKMSLDGPVIAGVSDMNETVSGQDEVDDLLSSLGF